MKIENLLNVRQSIIKLIRYSFSPMKLNKNIVDFYNDISSNLEFFDNERTKAFKKFGIINGDKIEIPPNKIEEFQKYMQEVKETEINISNKLEITEDDIYNADFCDDNVKNKLTPLDIMVLIEFINNQKEKGSD